MFEVVDKPVHCLLTGKDICLGSATNPISPQTPFCIVASIKIASIKCAKFDDVGIEH